VVEGREGAEELSYLLLYNFRIGEDDGPSIIPESKWHFATGLEEDLRKNRRTETRGLLRKTEPLVKRGEEKRQPSLSSRGTVNPLRSIYARGGRQSGGQHLRALRRKGS